MGAKTGAKKKKTAEKLQEMKNKKEDAPLFMLVHKDGFRIYGGEGLAYEEAVNLGKSLVHSDEVRVVPIES